MILIEREKYGSGYYLAKCSVKGERRNNKPGGRKTNVIKLRH